MPIEGPQNYIAAEERRRILAALKSGQSENKGFTDVYFMDNEQLLKDDEIMKVVAETHPFIIGHLNLLNKDQGFVKRWFSYIQDDAKRKEVYQDARRNNLKIALEDL